MSLDHTKGTIELLKGDAPKLREGQFIYKKCAYAVMVACRIIGRGWQIQQQRLAQQAQQAQQKSYAQ